MKRKNNKPEEIVTYSLHKNPETKTQKGLGYSTTRCYGCTLPNETCCACCRPAPRKVDYCTAGTVSDIITDLNERTCFWEIK